MHCALTNSNSHVGSDRGKGFPSFRTNGTPNQMPRISSFSFDWGYYLDYRAHVLLLLIVVVIVGGGGVLSIVML